MRHPLRPQNDPAIVFPAATVCSIAFTDDGLVMGDGSILVRMSKRGDTQATLALDDDRDRFTALMSVVGGRPMPADAIRHVEAADAHWQRGDKALANLRLIFADLPRVMTEADAYRLTLAEHLLDEGVSPAELLAELGLSAPSELEKYSHEQPRVPAGHGRESGRFGSGGGQAAPRADRALLPIVGAARAVTLSETIIGVATRVAGPVAFVAAMVVPTPNSGGIDEGTLSDMSDVNYRKDGPAGTLKLTTAAPNDGDITVLAHNHAGTYVDVRTEHVIGRDLGSSISLDKPAVRAAIDAEIAAQAGDDREHKPKAAMEEPQLCPASERDKPHGDRGLAYEIDVHARVNPEDPPKPRFGYRIWYPGEGEFYFVDDCFKKHGDLVDGDMKPGDFADAKGENYEKLFSTPFADSPIGKLRKQGERQVRAAAARGARVKWYFAQKGAADFIREHFKERRYLKEITIFPHAAAKGPMMGDKGYWASVAWGPRRETPEQLAVRLIEAIENIRDIDPLFAQWYTVPHEEIFEPLELRVVSVAERIALGVVRDDNDTPMPADGYSFSAYNFSQPKWTPSGFRMSIRIGSTLNWGSNYVAFATSLGCDPDPSLVSFDLFKRVLSILAEAFDAAFGETSSDGLAEVRRRQRDTPRLALEWMSYLGPRFAHFANPPPSAIVERRPNGGLFMAATDEVFSTDNPEHMAVARDIKAAIAPFNALKQPYPGLELPLD